VQILDHEKHRLPAGDRPQPLAQGAECLLAFARRREPRRRIALVRLQKEQPGKEGDEFRLAETVILQMPRQPIKARGRRRRALETEKALQVIGDRMQPGVLKARRTPPLHDRRRAAAAAAPSPASPASARTSSLIVCTSRDLPRPGSPTMSTTWPMPSCACSQRSVSNPTSVSRPVRGVSIAGAGAAKLLRTSDSPFPRPCEFAAVSSAGFTFSSRAPVSPLSPRRTRPQPKLFARWR